MSHFSVIVTDGSAVALRIQEVVGDWAQAGLVGESAWVCPDDVTATAGPPQVLSTVIGPGGIHRADLFHEIGVRRLDTVRLVVAQFIVTGYDQSWKLPELGRTLAELLGYTLPRTVSDEGEQETLLRRTNVLIPASGVSGVTTDALLPGWDANVVIAAEDRPDLDRASVFVREGGNYTGHAAAAIASVGALWSGIDGGCLDVLETDSTEMDTDVAVVRQAVRAVVRSNEVRDLADAACARVVADPSEPARVAQWARPALEPGPVVDSVLAETMETGDWATREPKHERAPKQTEKRFLAAVREAVAFNVRLIGFGIKAIVWKVLRVLEHIATGAIVGHRADQVVRFHPSSSLEIHRRGQAKLDAQPEELRRRMLVDEGGSVAAPSATTWVSLRRSCFGLADGSTLPGEYEVPEIAGKPQVLPPSSVVPNPTDAFTTMDGAPIRACDAQAATEYRSELREAAREPAPEPTRDSGRPTAASQTVGGDPLVGNASADDAETRRNKSEEKAKRKRAKDELAALEQWIGGRKDTLTWRIYEGVATKAALRQSEARRAYGDATATTQLPAEKLRGSQRKLIVAWSVLGVIFAAVLAYLWHWQYEQERMTPSELTKSLAGTFLVLLLIGMLFNHQFYKAVRHFEWVVEQTLARRRETAEQYVVARREASRLQLLASRLNDWAEIIGSVLHCPWTPAPLSGPTTAVESLTHLPAAVAVAVPPDQASGISPIVMARAVQVLTERGWANQLFDRGVDAYELNVRSARDSGQLAADLDTLSSPTSALGLLWAFFRTGEAGRYATTTARGQISEALDQSVLELPPRSVRRIGEHADGQAVSDSQFFGGVLFPAIPFVGDLWTPTGLLKHKNVPDQSLAWMPRAAGASRMKSLDRYTAIGDVAMRVDLSRRCVTSDLLVFAPEAAAKEQPSDRPAGDF